MWLVSVYDYKTHNPNGYIMVIMVILVSGIRADFNF